MTTEEIDTLEPTFHGTTWAREPDGAWKLPERTLGWQIAGWCAEYLKAEDGGPWRFTKEQLRFVLWWYAVDETGRFIYRKGVLQRLIEPEAHSGPASSRIRGHSFKFRAGSQPVRVVGQRTTP